MPKFGKTSQTRRKGVHPYLILVTDEVVKYYDITVLYKGGVRTDADQAALYAKGRTTAGSIVTKVDGVTRKSKHQIKKDGYGHALDVAPYPVDFKGEKARARFYMMLGHLFQAWETLKEKGLVNGTLRSGADWDGDKDFKDQSFDDLPHIELKGV